MTGRAIVLALAAVNGVLLAVALYYLGAVRGYQECLRCLERCFLGSSGDEGRVRGMGLGGSDHGSAA